MPTLISTARDPLKRLIDTPLAPYVQPYRQRLVVRGYAKGTQQQYIGCIAHFAVWLKKESISPEAIGTVLIDQFIYKHLPNCCCPGKVQRLPWQVRAALQQLIPVLSESDLQPPLLAQDVIQIELDGFDNYLRDQRGLAVTTRRQRRAIVGNLLRFCSCTEKRLPRLDSDLLRGFINDQLERWSPTSAAVMAGALRAYLRYRVLHGEEVDSLLPVVVSPACWRLAPLPETIGDADIERVLSSFDHSVPSRLRGTAVAQCVARLGLRSNEVVGLELEDIDWKAGTVRLRRCKTRRVDVMPLPAAVGAAIADYLCNERPDCECRRVFVRHVAPVEVPLQPSLVGRVIRDAYKRCGLPYTRVHIFRHSLAARVLNDGGTLKEVADLLRHRSLDTAQIYAKLDERRLSEVTMPWPGAQL